jgi:MSHA pilin protein MshC
LEREAENGFGARSRKNPSGFSLARRPRQETGNRKQETETPIGFPVSRPLSPVSCRGFTLVELVVTLIVLGILAASVAPRLIDRREFDVYGFFDATASFLRHAQKSAVAQRRTVCVAFGADSSVSLTVAKTFGGACDTPLADANGVTPGYLPPSPGIAFAARPNDFSFLPSGEASADQTIAIAGLSGKNITVWASTGYVQAE